MAAAAKPSAAAAAAARSASSRPRPPTGAPPVRLLAHPAAPAPTRKRACSCSPTTHPGSFRCALHRAQAARLPSVAPAPAPVSCGLGAARRPSMASPLVRIAAVEGGDHLRRALAALVRPSSQPRRRDAFRPRPSRLSAVSYAADGDEPSSPPRRFQ
ncbi:hypothetical protein EJB05_54266, partial [Eragrostis curvula]